MSYTLAQIMAESRYKADLTSAQFITDAELITYINNSLSELYELMVRTYGNDYFVDGYLTQTDGVSEIINMPNDFFKLVSVDINVGGNIYALLRFNFSDRNKYINSTEDIVNGIPKFRYRILNKHVVLHPIPVSIYDVVLWYVPSAPKLVNTTDEVSSTIIDGWVEYVITDAALKMAIKEDNTTKIESLSKAKAELAQRISSVALNRDFEQNIPDLDIGITLFNIRQQCKWRANVAPADVVSDIEVNSYVNNSLGELYDILISAYNEDYFITDGYTFSTANQQETYDLPSNFYKLYGADILEGNNYYRMERFPMGERNAYTNMYHINGTHYRYRLSDNKFRISPIPTEIKTIKLIYSPVMTKLSLDSDVIKNTIIESWLEYVYIDVAIKIGIKLGKDIQALLAQKQLMQQRLTEMKFQRDFGTPETVTDIYNTNLDW